MNKSKLEYIWLDGYVPTANLRSKTKVIDDFSGNSLMSLCGDLMAVQHSKLLLDRPIVFSNLLHYFPIQEEKMHTW